MRLANKRIAVSLQNNEQLTEMMGIGEMRSGIERSTVGKNPVDGRRSLGR